MMERVSLYFEKDKDREFVFQRKIGKLEETDQIEID